MANRMPPLIVPGHASCCFQLTAAEWRHWVAAGESLGNGLIAVARGLAALWRRAISRSRAPDNGDRSSPVSAAEARAEGVFR